jgi:hypothetical protein
LQSQDQGPVALAIIMAAIIFRCPVTGMDIQTLLQTEERDPARAYETITCAACARVHFINMNHRRGSLPENK